MRINDILKMTVPSLKKRNKGSAFVLLGPQKQKEEDDPNIEKFPCLRCKKKTEGKDSCNECGLKRHLGKGENEL